MCFVLAFAACGSEQENNDEYIDEHTEEYTDEYQNEYTTTQTLTIHAMDTYYEVIRRTEEEMARSLALEGIDFNVEISSYSFAEAHDRHMRMRAMMMAGQAYDMFFWSCQRIRDYAQSGFLLDFYTLIDQHPNTSRDDFFMNALEAFEFRGGLYTFPLSFGFNFIGINETLPESVTQQFVERDYITMHEALLLSNELRRDYSSEFGHLHMGISPLFTFMPTVFSAITGSFIDFDNRVSYLNSDAFVGFLSDFHEHYFSRPTNRVFEGDSFWSYPLGNFSQNYHWTTFGPYFFPQIRDHTLRDYTFMHLHRLLNPITALLEPIDAGFLNFIPLADEDGRLLIIPDFFFGTTSAKISITAATDGMLSWEFVQRLIPVMAGYSGGQSPSELFFLMGTNLRIPISRELFIPRIEDRIRTSATGIMHSGDSIRYKGLHDDGDAEQAIEDAIARMRELAEKSIAVIERHTNFPDFIYGDILQNFLMDITTAEETAQLLHERTALWLIE